MQAVETTVNALSVGQKVKWLHTMRGGYNDSWYVDGTVTKITPKTIYVEAVNLQGKTVVKRVKPQNVKPVTHAWHVADTHTAAEIADVVLVARVNGYVLNEYRKVCKDEPYTHMSELKAKYRSAYNVEMALSQAEMFGRKWMGAKR